MSKGSKRCKYLRLAFSPGQSVSPSACLFDEVNALIANERTDRFTREELLDAMAFFQPCFSGTGFSEAYTTRGAQLWFKLVPEQHIRHMNRIRSVLERCGYQFDLVQSERPGKVLVDHALFCIAIPERSKRRVMRQDVVLEQVVPLRPNL